MNYITPKIENHPRSEEDITIVITASGDLLNAFLEVIPELDIRPPVGTARDEKIYINKGLPHGRYRGEFEAELYEVDYKYRRVYDFDIVLPEWINDEAVKLCLHNYISIIEKEMSNIEPMSYTSLETLLPALFNSRAVLRIKDYIMFKQKATDYFNEINSFNITDSNHYVNNIHVAKVLSKLLMNIITLIETTNYNH